MRGRADEDLRGRALVVERLLGKVSAGVLWNRGNAGHTIGRELSPRRHSGPAACWGVHCQRLSDAAAQLIPAVSRREIQMGRSKIPKKTLMPGTRHMQSIAEWPVEERPREKLLLKGPETLTNAELLAIFLRIGVKGKSAIDLAQELLSRFGSLRGLYAAPVEELQTILGIGPSKIAQFKAVIEMSKRYLAEGFQNRPYVESSDDVLKFLYQEMRDLDQEVFKIVLLNGQNHILKIVEVTKGSLTAAQIYPREVVKLALRYSAAALVFVHNHPSGVEEPSENDKRITRDLVFACLLIGMKVHDHIIIGDNKKFSFADAGLIDQYAKELDARNSP